VLRTKSPYQPETEISSQPVQTLDTNTTNTEPQLEMFSKLKALNQTFVEIYSCGISKQITPLTSERILNGIEADRGQFPW
jgi:hypothetical protein